MINMYVGAECFSVPMFQTFPWLRFSLQCFHHRLARLARMDMRKGEQDFFAANPQIKDHLRVKCCVPAIQSSDDEHWVWA